VFDIYRGKQKPVNNFIEYAVFVSFFPLLVAGPIERANHLLPQVQQKRLFNYTQAIDGCRLILWGLAKKVILADYLAGIADNAFNNYAQYDGLSLIIGAIAFSFQIYGDFSGYSDIAIGTAKLFGFELLSNFKFPYFSRDIAEFWRRWHISLSSWFKDYLYIPLGGSHNGTFKAVRNTFIIFLISGFWHGASWNFIIWGGIHACAFLPLLLLKRNRIFVTNIVAEDRRLPNWREIWQMATTFMFVTIAWIFFRAQNLEHAIGYITQILTSIIHQPASILKPRGLTTFIYITPFVLIDWWQRRDERILKVPSNKIIRIVIYYFIVYKCILLMGEQSTFIYFQF
jgi:D-alanyl-lipoteichoic acid acyltransferase DltB (MBOAT superfamily)